MTHGSFVGGGELLLLLHGRGLLACSLESNAVGDVGASAMAEALKTNSALTGLLCVHWLWRVFVVVDLRLVCCCGTARGLA